MKALKKLPDCTLPEHLRTEAEVHGTVRPVPARELPELAWVTATNARKGLAVDCLGVNTVALMRKELRAVGGRD